MVSVQRIAPWLTGVLVVLAAVLSAQLSWLLVSLFTDVPQPVTPPVAASSSHSSQAASYNLDNILSTPLFGEKLSTTTPVEQEVKKSRLNIRLMGVIAGDTEEGVAVLFHDGREHAYAVGDRLDVREIITLQSVKPDFIIINRNGALEKIELEKKFSQGRVSKGVTVINRSSTAGNINLNTPYIRRLVGDPRSTLKNNPLRLMRYLNISPHVQQGKTVGFRVEPGRDKRLFPKLGLQSGDIVTAINNRSLGEVGVRDLLESVDSSRTFEITVLRNGTTQTIRLTL